MVTPVPFDLPLRLNDAAALAAVLLSQPFVTTIKPLTDEYRARVAARAGSISFESMTPHFRSLERDPVHPSAFYLCVDAADGQPFLLRVAPASTPSSGLFPNAILIGRTFIKDQEVLLNAVPFAPTDQERLLTYSEQVNKSFQPRPAGSRSVILVQAAEPAAAIPLAFEAFRKNLRNYGQNFTGFALSEGQDAAEFYFAVLWSAIRSGWCEGYTLHAPAPVALIPTARRRLFETNLSIARTIHLVAGITSAEILALLTA